MWVSLGALAVAIAASELGFTQEALLHVDPALLKANEKAVEQGFSIIQHYAKAPAGLQHPVNLRDRSAGARGVMENAPGIGKCELPVAKRQGLGIDRKSDV